MPRSCLLVHPTSYTFIAGVVNYIYAQLKAHSPMEVDLRLRPSIDASATDGCSVAFIIGDPFGRFTRQDGCLYIFINFSLLYCLGSERTCSRAGRRWIENKHRVFARKAHLYDYVLDFHSNETATNLSREFGIPARHFMVGLCDEAYRLHEVNSREYDVGFVGCLTTRRVTLARRLTRMGLRLSPSTGVCLEEIAARSRVVLNVHAYRTANVEWPRIVSALLSGAVLVTEASPYIENHIPGRFYVSSRYRDLASVTRSVLNASPDAELPIFESRGWMQDRYLAKCNESWCCLVADLYQDLGIN